MKFISKTANLHVILRPGMPAQPVIGAPAVPAISVRFQDGVAKVEQAELIDMMLKHAAFNVDFIAADEIGTDPFAYLRQNSEPTHVIQKIDFGHPTSRTATPVINQLPPEIKKLIQDQATEIAMKVAPEIAKQMLEKLLSEKKEAASAAEDVEEVGATMVSEAGIELKAKKGGRPKKS